MSAAMLRRVLRHLFTLCAVASLVLCVAVCVLWVGSLSADDLWVLESRRSYASLSSSRGRCGITHVPSKSRVFVAPQRFHQRGDFVFGDATLALEEPYHGKMPSSYRGPGADGYVIG